MMQAQLGLRTLQAQHCSEAAADARFEGSTKTILGHPALSKDCVPQLEEDAHLRVCSLLRMRAQLAATQKLHFIFASLKQRKKGLGFFVTYNENKGEVGKPHLLPGSTFYYPLQQEEFPHWLFRTSAFQCSTPSSSAATIAHWCVLTRNPVPSDTINSEEARVISLPDLLPPADHTRVRVLSYLNLLYMKSSLD